ncbi:MAG: hypothetical protein VB089_09260 [Anaerolineaceae bacterium]|nr:hypothetical protein [Anaerolineaceae bacterium]
MQTIHRLAIAILAACLCLACRPAGAAGAQAFDLVVLSDPQDPYYPLAQEIAQAEGGRLADSWDDALQSKPGVILWVAAPPSFSDVAMIAAGRALHAADNLPMVGILTGASLEDARALWQRGRQPHPGEVYAANAEYPTAGVLEARLVLRSRGASDAGPLTVQTLSAALQQAGYLTFTGHGSARYLRLDPDTTFTAADVPPLSGVVVSAGSCQTLRLWEKDSIALAFAHNGAAAYGGFVYSPIEGYLIGQFTDLPFRYTWPEFPIGMVAALQTQGSVQGYAAFPFYFLVGDPRQSFLEQPAYRLQDEQTPAAGERLLSYTDAPAGLIPVRIPGGARYRYVEIQGVGAATSEDRFYNGRVQTLAQGDDRYVVFTHAGGPFQLRLAENPPWHWAFSRPWIDAMDQVTLFLPMNDGDWIVLAAGLPALLVGLWRLRRSGRAGRRALLAAALLGALIAGLQAAYALLRLPHAAISSKPLGFSPLWAVAEFMLITGSALIYCTAKRRIGRAVAVVLATFSALAPGLLSLAIMTAYNLAISSLIPGGTPYNLHMAYLPLLAAAVQFLLFALLFPLLFKTHPLSYSPPKGRHDVTSHPV